jgi:hypothetical protein
MKKRYCLSCGKCFNSITHWICPRCHKSHKIRFDGASFDRNYENAIFGISPDIEECEEEKKGGRSTLKKIIFLLLLFGLVFSSAQSWAVNWKNYGKNKNFVCFYDKESVTHPSENIVRVWVKWVYTEEGMKYGNEWAKVDHSKILFEINRLERTYRILIGLAYNQEDQLITSSESE